MPRTYRGEIDLSMKNKLNRMKGHLNLEEQSSVKKEKKLPQTTDIPFIEKWNEHHTTAYYLDEQYCLIREIRYPIHTVHGNYSFTDFQTIVSLWNESNLDHPLSAKGLNSEDLFFFDTETTGLGAGAGTSIFLLGYAFFSGEEVIVRQHILPQPGGEVPFYHSFLENINYETLVTYNGKAFDWPQVKTQHTLIKNHVPLLPEFGHFDLYHASRRLWKNKLERVKLANVESEILGFSRQDDIPGYLAPIIYFDFLERQDPEILFGVLKHNELDVLSLITLYIHLSRQILQADGYGEESLEVARWLGYLGEKKQSIAAYEQVIQEGTEEDRLAAMHAIAYQKKREKDYNGACAIWQEVSEKGNRKHRREAALECAKLFEHQYKDYSKACEYVEKAFGELPISMDISSSSVMDLHKRLIRLKKKQVKEHLEKDKQSADN